MKILEICPFSAGICGVWARVFSESLEFKRMGFDIKVFSSNITKGTNKTAEETDINQGIKIVRFPAKASKLSSNVYSFSFEKEFKDYSPDIVITHLLHPHSFQALKLSLENNVPCYLVTHAPFNVNRKFPLNLLTRLYNYYRVKKKINKFKKIIAITKWELPFLYNLGVEKSRIAYIPNGLPEDFFKEKRSREHQGILFLGRIAPVKNIELLLKAAKQFPRISFTIVGSAEQEYLKILREDIEKTKTNNVSFHEPVYDLKEKIRIIDSHSILILPSKREAMPQVLLEAMARGKIVISSDTDGGKEIIRNGENGFLFSLDKEEQLFSLITKSPKSNYVRKNAVKTAENYRWGKLIKSYIDLISK